MRCALDFALPSAGSNSAARMAMMAITTNNSINVNAARWLNLFSLSFMPQCLHRIDLGCASGGQPTGEEPDGRKQHGNDDKRGWVSRTDVEKLTSHQTTERQAARQARRNSDGDNGDSLTKHHPQHVSVLSPQGHANPNLLAALAHGVGEHA